MSLISELRQWRDTQARREGVELFRVLSNRTIEELAQKRPQTEETLVTIKGIKEKKLQKYGKAILALTCQREEEVLKEVGDQAVLDSVKGEQQEKTFSVGDYLDAVNITLGTLSARIQGEISSFDLRGNYLFFTLKDKEDESSLSCFMWRRDYDMCGVELEEGLEVIAEGFPEVYKPSGRLTFRTRTLELVGEGALKKAYDELKKKLEKEGVFASERKKQIPEYPSKIGLITSKEGAVIHDFLNNLGQHNFSIQCINSRVEGQLAVQELYTAIRSFRKKDLDVLVIVRGGGSLESLQAFNNEVLVREIIKLPFPVICGIGHHQDAPLMTLAADAATSTPTAVTKLLNHSWEHALSKVHLAKQSIFNSYEHVLRNREDVLRRDIYRVEEAFVRILERCKGIFRSVAEKTERLQYAIQQKKQQIQAAQEKIFSQFQHSTQDRKSFLNVAEKTLSYNDPHRQLKLGYSLVTSKGNLVRSVGQVKKGEDLEVTLSDGKLSSTINIIKKDNK